MSVKHAPFDKVSEDCFVFGDKKIEGDKEGKFKNRRSILSFIIAMTITTNNCFTAVAVVHFSKK